MINSWPDIARDTSAYKMPIQHVKHTLLIPKLRPTNTLFCADTYINTNIIFILKLRHTSKKAVFAVAELRRQFEFSAERLYENAKTINSTTVTLW